MANHTRSEKERRAMFAHMFKSPMAKKAAIGAALAIGGAVVASKVPAFRRRALAIAGAGAAAASEYSGRAYQYAKDKQDQADLRRKQASGYARAMYDNTVARLGKIPVEDYAARAVDLPFSVGESWLARQLDRRTGNVEKVLARRLGEYQQLTTAAVAKQARKRFDQAAGPVLRSTKVRSNEGTAGYLDATRRRAEFEQEIADMSKRTKLRRTVEERKWDQLLATAQQDMMERFTRDALPSQAERHAMLANEGIPVTAEEDAKLVQRLIHLYGLSPGAAVHRYGHHRSL